MTETAREQREVARVREVYRGYDRGDVRRWAVDNPGNTRILGERDQLLRECAQQLGCPASITLLLDVGCGDGHALLRLHDLLALDRSVALDVRMDRLTEIRRAGPNGIHVLSASGLALPIRSGVVEVVSVLNIFSSVLDATLRRNLALEVDRVLQPGGIVLWYDVRRPNPRSHHVTAINRDELTRLFPGWVFDIHPVSLLPPVARHLGRFTTILYPPLNRFTFLRTHLGGAMRKPR
jgi:SAM-dependent methyltransferase